MSDTPKTFEEWWNEFEVFPEPYAKSAWTAAREALMAELLEGVKMEQEESWARRIDERGVDGLDEALDIARIYRDALDHSRASEAALRHALELERETSHQLREARHQDVVEDGAELASLRKRLAEAERLKCGILCEQTTEERDDYAERIAKFAAVLGCEEEWSSNHDHRECVPEKIFSLQEDLRYTEKRLAEVEAKFRLHRKAEGSYAKQCDEAVEDLREALSTIKRYRKGQDKLRHHFGIDKSKTPRQAVNEVIKRCDAAESQLTRLRTHFGIPEGEDVVETVIRRLEDANNECHGHIEVGQEIRRAADAGWSEKTLDAVKRLAADRDRYMVDASEMHDALNELVAYHNLPSDLPPMRVAELVTKLFQEVQARVYRGSPCGECGGQGGGQDEGGSWTCGTCGGSGSELDALKREVQALKADIQNREVNAREAVERLDAAEKVARAAVFGLSTVAIALGVGSAPLGIWDGDIDRIRKTSKEADKEAMRLRNQAKLAEQVSRGQGPGKVDREAPREFFRAINVAELANSLRSMWPEIITRGDLGPEQLARRLVEWMEGRR